MLASQAEGFAALVFNEAASIASATMPRKRGVWERTLSWANRATLKHRQEANRSGALRFGVSSQTKRLLNGPLQDGERD